jgi:hypothetical protein
MADMFEKLDKRHGKLLYLFSKLYSPFIGWDSIQSAVDSISFWQATSKSANLVIVRDGELIGFISMVVSPKTNLSGTYICATQRSGRALVEEAMKRVGRVDGHTWSAHEWNYPSLKLMMNLGGVILGKTEFHKLNSSGVLTLEWRDVKGCWEVTNDKFAQDHGYPNAKYLSKLYKGSVRYLNNVVKPAYMDWVTDEFANRANDAWEVAKELERLGYRNKLATKTAKLLEGKSIRMGSGLAELFGI